MSCQLELRVKSAEYVSILQYCDLTVRTTAVQTVNMMLSCIHTTEGEHVPQQEEAGNDGAAGDGSVAPDPSTAIPDEMVVSSLSSSVSINTRNMVGFSTYISYIDKMEQQHISVSAKEDSEERKKKAMDRLRKVSAYNCMLPFVVCLVYTSGSSLYVRTYVDTADQSILRVSYLNSVPFVRVSEMVKADRCSCLSLFFSGTCS